MNTSTSSDDLDIQQRFMLGLRLGQCLVRGCIAFSGDILSIGHAEKEAGEDDAQRAMMLRNVDIKVRDWLYRKEVVGAAAAPASPDTVRVQHAGAPGLGKTAVGPWSAWADVQIQVGTALWVARWAGNAPRASWRGQPEDIALAVSEKRLFPALREAAVQQRRFERDPSEVTVVAKRLAEKNDVLFSAYLLTYLTEHEATRNVDRAAGLLAGLLGHPALPEPGRALVTDWLASSFYRLSKPTRQQAVESLLVAAGGSEGPAALPALKCLIRLADQKLLELPATLAGTTRQKIIDGYRALQTKDKSVHPEFEWLLGLR